MKWHFPGLTLAGNEEMDLELDEKEARGAEKMVEKGYRYIVLMPGIPPHYAKSFRMACAQIRDHAKEPGSRVLNLVYGKTRVLNLAHGTTWKCKEAKP